MAQTVLIVEDDDNVAPLEIALGSMREMTVRVLGNGRDALRVLRDRSLDLAAVITDLNLPYVDGFEIIEAIRSDQRYSQLPVVVISGEADPEIPNRLRNLGVNAFFSKPYSPVEIRKALEGLIHAA